MTRSPARTRRTTGVLAAALVGGLLLGGCASEAGDGDAASPSSTTVAPTSTTAPSTTTTTAAGRALVTATTVQPLVAATTTEADAGTPLDELAVGDCADLPGLGLDDTVEVTHAEVVDCATPHAVEVFLVTSLNGDPDAPYPGDETVLAAADQACLDAFPAYVGVAYVDATLEIVHLRPDEELWLRGDRDVRCAVHNRDMSPLTATVRSGTG